MIINKNKQNQGYTLIILLFAIFILTLGLMVAAPVWQTQIQRELEEELIFRGKQYVEAIRLYQTKFPGGFPQDFDVLLEEKCLRRLFKDPMTEHGEWNVILNYGKAPTPSSRQRTQFRSQRGASVNQETNVKPSSNSPQTVLIAPQAALNSIKNAQIIGVVSPSTMESKRIYLDQNTYDKWLFFFGQDPKKLPKIIYYSEEKKQ